MAENVVEGKWKEFRGQLDKWRNKPGQTAEPAAANSNREEVIQILQERYGYTQEKAASELEKHYSKIRWI